MVVQVLRVRLGGVFELRITVTRSRLGAELRLFVVTVMMMVCV